MPWQHGDQCLRQLIVVDQTRAVFRFSQCTAVYSVGGDRVSLRRNDTRLERPRVRVHVYARDKRKAQNPVRKRCSARKKWRVLDSAHRTSRQVVRLRWISRVTRRLL